MKLKKLSACMLAVIFTAACIPAGAFALSNDEVKAPSAILMEAQTGKILFEKNDHEKRAAASITKVMTLLLVMEAIDSGKIALTDKVSVSDQASSMGGSQIWLKPGEVMTVDDMLKATVIASANDAAEALGEYVAGSREEFVNQMNARAKSLKMNDTTFKNSYGLDEDGHVTSAYDVALMSRELIKHQKIFDYTKTWMDSLRGGKTQLVNTNRLLKTYRGITGLKTGTTSKAGSCISATAERDGVSLIAVVLGCPDTKTRFAGASTLLDYGFANWSVAKPAIPNEAKQPVAVQNGMEANVGTTVNADNSILVPKGKNARITYKVDLPENVPAPITEGQVLGKVSCSLNGEVLQQYDICAKNSVAQITFGAVFRLLARELAMAG